MAKSCTHCESTEHSQFYCRQKPRKAIKAKKPMSKSGPTKKEWLATRAKWLKENHPNHQGYYECYICKKWVDYTEITLDHIKARSRRPDLVHDFNNLAPCCSKCNSDKGSRDLSEI